METLVFVTWEIIMFMLNLTVCLVYTGYAFAIQSHANIQVQQRCWIVFIRATFSKRNKYSHFPLKIKSRRYRRGARLSGRTHF